MLGRRSLMMGLALVGVLVVGQAAAPVVYRALFLNTRLAAAIKNWDLDQADALIASGANAGLRVRPPAFSGRMVAESALDLAVRRFDVERVRRFVTRGADVNERYEDGSTPLLNAAVFPDPRMVKALAALGAAVQARDANGETALMYSAAHGGQSYTMGIRDLKSTATVRSLLDMGVDPHLKDDNGETALSKAEQCGERLIAAELAKTGSPGLREELRGEPKPELFYAVRCRDLGKVKRLLRGGARIAVQDRKGLSPLMYAAGQYDGRIIHHLIHHAHDLRESLELKDSEGSTALARAYIWDYSFKLLLDAGADPNVSYGGTRLVDFLSGNQKKQLVAAGAKSTR